VYLGDYVARLEAKRSVKDQNELHTSWGPVVAVASLREANGYLANGGARHARAGQDYSANPLLREIFPGDIVDRNHFDADPIT